MSTPTADASSGVSLVITVLNEAASLEPLLASIAAQTCPPAEIIVVDGGSTDGTLDVLA
ncbi:MAG: glycosyltransferase family 2 protein, partial [Thermomicrobiales bacterium]